MRSPISEPAMIELAFCTMARRVDQERIRHAQLSGAVHAIRDQVRLDQHRRLEQLRTLWPELAERIEAAVTLIDW